MLNVCMYIYTYVGACMYIYICKFRPGLSLLFPHTQTHRYMHTHHTHSICAGFAICCPMHTVEVYIDTHIDTDTYTHTQNHCLTFTPHACACSHVHTHTHAHMNIYIYSSTLMHTHVHVDIYVHVYMCTCIRAHAIKADEVSRSSERSSLKRAQS